MKITKNTRTIRTKITNAKTKAAKVNKTITEEEINGQLAHIQKKLDNGEHVEVRPDDWCLIGQLIELGVILVPGGKSGKLADMRALSCFIAFILIMHQVILCITHFAGQLRMFK